MEVYLVVVPPNQDEAEYTRLIEMPSVPEPGQNIEIDTDDGMEFYEVSRLNRWSLSHPGPTGGTPKGELDSVAVEVEPIRGPKPAESEHHQNFCDRLDITKKFERPFL